MWGNKKPDSEVPQAAMPPAPRAAEPSPINPVTKPVEGISMSTDSIRPLASSPVGSTARLGASLHVKGEITGNEDLHIDGSVEGLVQLDDRKLTVGASAKLTADVVAREVVVYGSVKGNLRARDRIEIKKDGSVIGDLTTARIMIEDGAYFKGSIEIDRKGEAELEKPAYAQRTSTAATPVPQPAHVTSGVTANTNTNAHKS